MARRGSFLAALERAARQAARQQRLAEAAQRREARELLSYQREQIRLKAQMDKDERQRYVASRIAEAEEQTAKAKETVLELQGILAATLAVNDAVNFDTLRIAEITSDFEIPNNLVNPTVPPNRDSFLRKVRPVTFLERLLSRQGRYERELAEAEERYSKALEHYTATEEKRRQAIANLEAEHKERTERRLVEIRQANEEVDELKRAYGCGEAHAVMAYCSMVLERSYYPEGCPQAFRLAYLADGKQLVIDYELPALDVVPKVLEYRYIKTRDTIEEKYRKPVELKYIYQDIIAAIALRTIHEVFEADLGNHISVVAFSGFVRTIDPSTGKDIAPYLISVRATKESFNEIDLGRIDRKACLRNLGAQVSPQPAELQPVKPLIEFDMVDKRFVEGTDILSDLESRPNLMDLTPFEFEQLVGNLFSKMGLESKQTRSSRDGGIDVVAYDTRPLIGGKVVIQAKRYRNTVGVSAVRDLFGTMNHEGANKGILVTTSSYGTDAYEFIKGKPIELIDGSGLLYYLEQNASIKARIVFPIEESLA